MKDSMTGTVETLQEADKRGAGFSHRVVALSCAVLVGSMLGMAYAAVPLYQMFCQVTGYGGTTQVAAAPSAVVLDKQVTMRFDANVSNDLAWDFRPVDVTMNVKIGENRLATYTATNTSDKVQTGTATFNVTPEAAGVYFNKIECFCFTEQVLQPGETVRMPVSFFVDPAIVDDQEIGGISQITLSYTFFPTNDPKREVRSESAAVGRSKS